MKKVNLDLTTVNGNAFFILGAFHKQARKEGWNREEIKEVLDKAKSGDYNNLIGTIMEYCL